MSILYEFVPEKNIHVILLIDPAGCFAGEMRKSRALVKSKHYQSAYSRKKINKGNILYAKFSI